MPTHILNKRSNPIVKKLVEVRKGINKNLVFVEGFKIITDLCNDGQNIELFSTQKFLKESKSLKRNVHILSDRVMAFVSDLKTSPGIIGLTARPHESLTVTGDPPFVLVLHKIQLPQNVGALMRTAEAAGIKTVWTTMETADPFHPKSIRGSSGSVFRLSIASNRKFTDLVKMLNSKGINVFGATQNGSTPYDAVPWNNPTALVMGSEGSGFSPQEIRQLDQTISIPMLGKVDSLNVGVAGALCMFEARKIRQSQN